jgi:trans-aconitate 2-methyltransferase
MSDWNPTLYARFEDERTRPAVELLARVPIDAPRHVVDLGCGPGNSTELLVERFPTARIVGTDSSQAMLAAARQRLPQVAFEQGDIAEWSPVEPVDLAYANASLQWVSDHPRLLPRLLSALTPGGVLAVQMPDNLDEPSHRLMRVTAAALLGTSADDADKHRARILSTQQYYDLLTLQADVDVWRTTYHHRMDDAAAIVQWLRATGLKPYVDPLAPELQTRFLAEYQRRIEQAYLARADGKRLLAFPRLFIVARRRDR